jgi:hypothetical protein
METPRANLSMFQVLPITVDYDFPIEGYFARGLYGEVPLKWRERIPITAQASGQVPRFITLLKLVEPAVNDAVVAAIADNWGKRPADAHELLALGADEPALQRLHPIIALGAIWDAPQNGGPYALALTFRFNIRKVEFVWPHRNGGSKWSPESVFAVLDQ